MQTLKFTFNLRVNTDCNIAISTEHIVNDEEDAQIAGRIAKRLTDSFLNAYSNEAGNEES